jgi:hypothetical protein
LVAIITLLLVALTAALPRGSAAQADEVAGDYTVSITDEAVDNSIANGSVLIGRWRISFGEDGAYEAERLDLGVLVRGSYQVDGNRLTITDEEGLVSCSTQAMTPGEDADVRTGAYTFERDDSGLTLTVEEDSCPTRRVLLTTTGLTPFTACNAEPVSLGAEEEDAGADEEATAGADETADEEETVTPEPEDSVDDEEATAEPAIDRPAPGDRDTGPEEGSTEEQIDELLAQMSACWATGDPALFMALWSEDFRSSFIENPADVEALRLAMQVPTAWERSGDVELDGDDEAEAVVRERTLNEEEFIRFRFVREDGVWKWDGTAA